jgi:hypothetical protein
LFGLCEAAPVSPQATPNVAMGAYAARHGLGVELQGKLVTRIGLVARAEAGTVEHAYWWGARLDVLSSPDSKAYLDAFAGQHYCAPSTLSGTGSGCGHDADEWKSGWMILGGVELGQVGSRWSIGAEGGRRFLDAGTRPKWTFGAIVRWRFLP